MRTGFKVGLLLLAATIILFQVRSCLRTDEDRVLGLIAEAEEGWNDASARRTVAPLAEDFVLVPMRQGKDWLRGILFNIYLNNRDPKSREFLYRAEIDWDRIELRFVDPEYAQVRGHLAIERTDGNPGWEYDGDFGIEARKRNGEWRIVAVALQGLGEHRSRTRKKPEQG